MESVNTPFDLKNLAKQSEFEDEAEEPMHLKIEMQDLNKSLEEHPNLIQSSRGNESVLSNTKSDRLLFPAAGNQKPITLSKINVRSKSCMRIN
jgi:hypothetical protein